MLPNLKILNFRMLRHLEIPRLARVNLIVGKNNSGKSTVLEALQVYAQRARPVFLDALVKTHKEENYDVDEDDYVLNKNSFFFHNIFFNRAYPKTDEGNIFIGAQGDDDFIKIEHKLFIEETVEVDTVTGHESKTRKIFIDKNDLDLEKYAPGSLRAGIMARIKHHSTDERRIIAFFGGENQPRMGMRSYYSDDVAVLPTGFIPTQLITDPELAALWDDIALTEYEASVIEALQIIEPNVIGLTFKKSKSTSRGGSMRERNDERAPVVKLNGHVRPIPLGGMGDGMARILQIILAIYPARSGMFMIDEFENGLHHSVQEKVWDLVFRLAIKLNIQVFATTHSMDCVGSFAKIASNYTEDSSLLIRVGKSVAKKQDGGDAMVIATIFDANQVKDLLASEIEVR
jgi:ABC-type branched-subunit amino acid transport system ATPase component